MSSLLFRGGSVLDGSGGPAIRADVLVEGERIAAVRPRLEPTDRSCAVVDARDLTLAPGFIDMHSHADFTMPTYPGALNSLAQGVTTEVVGNCGHTPAPLPPEPRFAEVVRAAGRALGPDLDWAWTSFGSFLDALDDAHPSVNAIPLVGFGTIRSGVMGAEDRPATVAERDAMRRLVSQALAEGAWGMSTGLVYPPGSFAAPDEVRAVAGALAPADALYTSHIRDEGASLLDALHEAVETGRRLGLRVEVSHLKAAGREHHGATAAALTLLDEARDDGVRVTQDVYPYVAANTLLSQLVPPWAHDGGTAALVERLGSESVRARIAAAHRTGALGWTDYVRAAGGWNGILITSVVEPSLRHLQGLRVDEAARRAGVDPLTLVLDTLVRDRAGTAMVMFIMDPTDVERVVEHPSSAIGSDQLGVTSPTARTHPRAYGTFVRALAMSRERGTSLEAQVHRMTGLPARILGLADRGRIGAGAFADLVLFDPATVADRATYEDPALPPTGIEAVVVNGRLAMRHGRPVDVAAGRVLRWRGAASRDRDAESRSGVIGRSRP